jgi:hypothetical protein
MATTIDIPIPSANYTLTNIPFLEDEDLQVIVDDGIVSPVTKILNTDYTVINKTSSPVAGAGYLSGAQINFITALPASGTVTVTRITPLQTAQTFTAGSAIRAQDLNNNFQRTYFSAEESQQIAVDASLGDILDNSIAGVKLENGAVTTDKIANLTILNEDISLFAAINGTKIQQANTTTRGTVQLYNAADSTSTTLAATANALKTVNDTLTTAINTIDATQPFTRTSTGTGRLLEVGEHVTVTAATQSFDLPATPTNGQTLRISVGNFTDTVITRNGSNIMASNTDLTIDVALKTITLMYDTNDDGSGSNTVGWRII